MKTLSMKTLLFITLLFICSCNSTSTEIDAQDITTEQIEIGERIFAQDTTLNYFIHTIKGVNYVYVKNETSPIYKDNKYK